MDELDEMIERIEICREGRCGDCIYYEPPKSCTDTLIDDLYAFLLKIRKAE